MNGLRTPLVCALMCLAAAAHADPQHDQYAQERAAANARFDAQRQECQTRFVVTRCVDAARKEQQATLARLRALELQRADAKRSDSAAARERSLSDKAKAQQARASEAPEVPRAERIRLPSPPKPPIAHRSEEQAARSNATEAEDRRARERRNEEAFDMRTRAAQAHREEVERRNAERAARGKVVAPLPVPSGAAAAP